MIAGIVLIIMLAAAAVAVGLANSVRGPAPMPGPMRMVARRDVMGTPSAHLSANVVWGDMAAPEHRLEPDVAYVPAHSSVFAQVTTPAVIIRPPSIVAPRFPFGSAAVINNGHGRLMPRSAKVPRTNQKT